MMLIYFILLFIVFFKSKSIVFFFVLLQVVSLLGMMLIGQDYPINSLFKFFNLILTIVILTLIIIPWQNFKDIKEITNANEIKLKKLTKFLILISIFPFITFLTTSIFVFLFIDDINAFKYAEGVSDEFYYSLPFDVRAIILSAYMYGFSYLLIPLHFYYLSKRNYRLSFWCFIFSLNIVLFGLTYFSRSVFVHYAFIYIAFLIMLYGTLENRVKKHVKNIVFLFLGLMSIYFVNISVKRFTTDNLYAENIPVNSFIQDPVLYSYFDYLSQWYYNNMYLLNSYNFKTFHGQISFQSVLSLLGQYNIISYDTSAYSALRQQLWPLHWYTFNGFVAYTVYDLGYVLAIVFALIYCLIISRLKPKHNQISLMTLFLVVSLIQLPLLAIFYSTFGGILIPMLLSIPVFIYMKISVKVNI
jgi:oligosaccharide repeat unit polymerase